MALAGRVRGPQVGGAVAAMLAASVLIPFSGTLTTRPQGEGCVGDSTIPIVASVDKIGVVRRLAREFTGPHGYEMDGERVCLDVLNSQSGSALLKLIEAWRRHDAPGAVDAPGPFDDYPLIWMPASSMWWVQLKERTDSCGDRANAYQCARNELGLSNRPPKSLARSPMVVAVRRSDRSSLDRFKTATITWKDFTDCGDTPCDPPLGKTNPNVSTIGLEAALGMIWEAGDPKKGGAVKEISDMVRKPDAGKPFPAEITRLRAKVREGVRAMEKAFGHYGHTTIDLLCGLTRKSGNSRQAIVIEEQTVWLYNTGGPAKVGCPDAGPERRPDDPLVPIFLKHRSILSDHPFVLIDPAPKTHPAENKVAQAFQEHLLAPERQKEFQDLGFRVTDPATQRSLALGARQVQDLYPGEYKAVYEEGFNDHLQEPPCVAAEPAGNNGTISCPRGFFDDVLTTWATELRKPLRAQMLIDYSGSMDDPVRETGAAKIDIAMAGVEQMIAGFHEGDAVGVRVFATLHPERKRDWEDILPLSKVTKSTLADVQTNFRRFATTRHPSGTRGTGLYDSIADAVANLAGRCETGSTSSVIVLTDGADSKKKGLTLDGLAGKLGGDDQNCAVRVLIVAYGTDIDSKAARAMGRIADATSGQVYYATDPASLGTVLTDLIADF
ncbi:vWA domain-containing protein [Sphaerisporangium dianthi]|uniref:VWFA domain-containing protein n=1 Tax=Sphaerisporangium dianthi TaxID=1436120 RepID=A0ABV9CCN0_9ACTN